MLEILICPSCLPEENYLELKHYIHEYNDIVSGNLICNKCGTKYRIENGIAILTPNPNWTPSKDNKYENPKVISSYLWSHYGDWFNDTEWIPAYPKWASLINSVNGISLDIGSAVGRTVFELANKSKFSIGIDLSLSFVKTARELMKNRELNFELIEEGYITKPAKIKLPDGYQRENIDFIVADALALPFKREVFKCVISLNVIDKVSLPFKHIEEMNRVSSFKDAQLLISDPFSWSEEVAKIGDWLGGKREGDYSGYGIENIVEILKNQIYPSWIIADTGEVFWKIRNHRNHFEFIRSLYVKASR
ncbi:SAM-dependent methyltransferase [Thermodesulfovibrio sp. N1]|uniref:class I SAM-dependent methyltransferase n=1 Tax=Thermodesulfovibrio sp. N1 TaxID=1871110 RepID=UPI00085623C1|nr:methyltransferase domain-containing protein [Thermodesulfovibrio sp. N1]ODA43653.1 SAM-dependent methyltransferase [Thermodesulfovibrio sp. N1]